MFDVSSLRVGEVTKVDGCNSTLKLGDGIYEIKRIAAPAIETEQEPKSLGRILFYAIRSGLFAQNVPATDAFRCEYSGLYGQVRGIFEDAAIRLAKHLNSPVDAPLFERLQGAEARLRSSHDSNLQLSREVRQLKAKLEETERVVAIERQWKTEAQQREAKLRIYITSFIDNCPSPL